MFRWTVISFRYFDTICEAFFTVTMEAKMVKLINMHQLILLKHISCFKTIDVVSRRKVLGDDTMFLRKVPTNTIDISLIYFIIIIDNEIETV